MRGVIALMMAVVFIGCNDGGSEPELVPDYKLSHLTGTWEGDSDCVDGRYRIRFDAPIPGTTYLTGRATLLNANGTGQCVETRTEPITALLAFGGAVTVYWPLVGAPVHDRLVYRTTFVTLREFDTGSLTLEGSPGALVPPGQFAMTKR